MTDFRQGTVANPVNIGPFRYIVKIEGRKRANRPGSYLSGFSGPIAGDGAWYNTSQQTPPTLFINDTLSVTGAGDSPPPGGAVFDRFSYVNVSPVFGYTGQFSLTITALFFSGTGGTEPLAEVQIGVQDIDTGILYCASPVAPSVPAGSFITLSASLPLHALPTSGALLSGFGVAPAARMDNSGGGPVGGAFDFSGSRFSLSYTP